ncbi:AraC family transcriptional regulator [Paraglaciecola sp.]|uniref:AraC family transcriptional regulator n=1 Tax=Paraglaciecola sp. TaxID=1920173 RepID=UPI0030F4490A
MSQSPGLIRRLLRSKDRIDEAPHEEWPISRLAEVSAVSVAHFAREFKKAFGLPPHRYLLTRRIERATALLRETNLPITDIALETGWNSVGTFGRIFRDITDESPSEFRQRERNVLLVRHNMPECVVRAIDRPNLNIAVSEKRQLTVVGKLKS